MPPFAPIGFCDYFGLSVPKLVWNCFFIIVIIMISIIIIIIVMMAMLVIAIIYWLPFSPLMHFSPGNT